MTTDLMQNVSRLKWACRRGMLELDVLLGNFLKEAYPSLSAEEKLGFVNLLNSHDVDLIDWLMGYSHPEDAALTKTIQLVRKHARARV